jgi:DegV family protein with EDD domain
MRIAISAESTIDMPKEMLKEYDIHTLPFTILLGNKAKLDGNIEPKEIFEYVLINKVLPKTSAVNEYQYEEHFKKILKKYDAIIHFSLSSEMSSAYFNACKVADNMNNVYVVDTRSLSTGIALQAIYASKLVKEGFEASEIVEKVKARIPYTQASFVLSRLDYLYKGGRCNAMQLLGSNLLKIHPQIIVSNGKMDAHKKFRGNMSSVVFKYVEATLEEFNNPDLEEVFITYTTANLDVISEIKNILVARGFKNIHITTAGATISSHCGEHCLGILYMNDGDRK